MTTAVLKDRYRVRSRETTFRDECLAADPGMFSEPSVAYEFSNRRMTWNPTDDPYGDRFAFIGDDGVERRGSGIRV